MNARPFILRKRTVTFYRDAALTLLLFVGVACIEGGDAIKAPMTTFDVNEDSEIVSEFEVPDTMSCSSCVVDLAEYDGNGCKNSVK